MKVEYDAIVEPPNLGFRIYPTQELAPEQVERLDRLTLAWYDVGSCGGFGGRFHFGSEMEWDEDERAFVFWVDMGTAGEPAIEALVRILEGFAENEGIEFERLVVGFPATGSA